MDNVFALDPFEVIVLLLWALGLMYVLWNFLRRRSIFLMFVLLAALCIPGVGICYAAIREARKLKFSKNEE